MKDIIDIIKLISNPKQYALNMVQQQSNPMMQNLIQMAERNDKEGLEKFARNMFKEKGMDYDKEVSSLKQFFK